MFFVTYDTLKRNLNPIISENYITDNKNLADSVTHMISASCGEVAACLVRVPAEVIKQRTQASHFSSSLESLKFILRNENGEGVLKGLYRGWGTTIMREIPFTVIQFPLYEYLKSQWATRDNKEKVSPLQGAICGSIAGGVAAATTTPLDVLKTRIMLSETRIGVIQIFKNIIKEEGPKAFLSGIGPRTMWISAGGAIFLGVYETVSTILSASAPKFDK